MDNSTYPNNNFKQEVIDDNNKIFEILKETLTNAKSEILIAAAWFTDPVLFDIVIERLKNGVKVNLIIADNAENDKLQFDDITKLGGFCIKIKSVGFGMMHQKFCVTDQTIAIHGSYNFTLNARNNNHESVIYTTHKETVQNLINNFNAIKIKAIALKEGLPIDDINNDYVMNNNTETKDEITTEMPPIGIEEKRILDFEKVLSTLIEAEINHFDRKELYENGKLRSESCSGDYNTLYHALDSIYYNFINDINITDELKKLLLVKINEHKSRSLQLLEVELAQKQNNIKIEFNTNREIYARTINEKKIDVDKNDKIIEGIKKIDIETVKRKITELKDKIIELKKEHIIPDWKLHELIPQIIINIFLFIYIMLFYSSAAYILIYLKDDIENQKNHNLPLQIVKFFEPDAIPLALNHGLIALMFILVFIFLPLAFTLANKFIDIKWLANTISYGIGLIAIDFFVSLTIIKTIHEAAILRGDIPNEEWKFQSSFTNSDFYLVFIFGAMGLLIFKFTYNKLIDSFAERNHTIQTQKSKLEIEHTLNEIQIQEQDLIRNEKEIEKLQLANIDNKKQREDIQYKLDNLPINEISEIDKAQKLCIKIQEHYEHITGMYINKVENNNPRISIDALKDRISIFLNGWNDHLHSYFAIPIAIEKSRKATEVYDDWRGNKLSNNDIDSRVNY